MERTKQQKILDNKSKFCFNFFDMISFNESFDVMKQWK